MKSIFNILISSFRACSSSGGFSNRNLSLYHQIYSMCYEIDIQYIIILFFGHAPHPADPRIETYLYIISYVQHIMKSISNISISSFRACSSSGGSSNRNLYLYHQLYSVCYEIDIQYINIFISGMLLIRRILESKRIFILSAMFDVL